MIRAWGYHLVSDCKEVRLENLEASNRCGPTLQSRSARRASRRVFGLTGTGSGRIRTRGPGASAPFLSPHSRPLRRLRHWRTGPRPQPMTRCSAGSSRLRPGDRVSAGQFLHPAHLARERLSLRRSQSGRRARCRETDDCTATASCAHGRHVVNFPLAAVSCSVNVLHPGEPRRPTTRYLPSSNLQSKIPRA